MDKLLYRPRGRPGTRHEQDRPVRADPDQANPLHQGRQIPVHHGRCLARVREDARTAIPGSELDATATTDTATTATATQQRRWLPLRAPRRLLGWGILRTDSLRET